MASYLENTSYLKDLSYSSQSSFLNLQLGVEGSLDLASFPELESFLMASFQEPSFMLDKTDMVMENIEVRHIPVGASYVLDSSLGQHDIGGSIRG